MSAWPFSLTLERERTINELELPLAPNKTGRLSMELVFLGITIDLEAKECRLGRVLQISQVSVP